MALALTRGSARCMVRWFRVLSERNSDMTHKTQRSCGSAFQVGLRVGTRLYVGSRRDQNDHATCDEAESYDVRRWGYRPVGVAVLRCTCSLYRSCPAQAPQGGPLVPSSVVLVVTSFIACVTMFWLLRTLAQDQDAVEPQCSVWYNSQQLRPVRACEIGRAHV